MSRRFDLSVYAKLMFQRGLDPSDNSVLQLFQAELDGHIPDRKDARYGGELSVIADRVKAAVTKQRRYEEFSQQSSVSNLDRLSAAYGNDPQRSLHPTQTREPENPLQRLSMFYQERDDLQKSETPWAFSSMDEDDLINHQLENDKAATYGAKPDDGLKPLERLQKYFENRSKDGKE